MDQPELIQEHKAAHQNYGRRPAGMEVDCVVLHATAGSLQATLGWFENPDSGVSAHFVVAKNGDVYQMVQTRFAAYHAGRSAYRGRRNFNDFSIGIEIVNKNDGQDPYPDIQVHAVCLLVEGLVRQYEIGPDWVVTHRQISYDLTGKTDPRGFPMDYVKQWVYGPHPKVVQEAAWVELGYGWHPGYALARYAAENELGAPISEEFEFSMDGIKYVARGFALAIVYCRFGDWGHVYQVPW